MLGLVKSGVHFRIKLSMINMYVKEVHDWIKAITINWSISVWEQSISQDTNKVYMRTQNISRIGYKLGKGWKGIFSIEKAFIS